MPTLATNPTPLRAISAQARADVAARRLVRAWDKAATERLLRATVGRLTALPPWAFDAAREPV